MKPMKEFVFLDIPGKIHKEKVESYLPMVQRLFLTMELILTYFDFIFGFDFVICHNEQL